MSADPIQKIEAQTVLQNLKIKAELENFGQAIDRLFAVKAMVLNDIVTAEELKSLISAVQAGTADNAKLTRFITVGNIILSKI